MGVPHPCQVLCYAVGMTGRHSSVWLPDDVAAALDAAGLKPIEAIRRGLEMDAPDVSLIRVAVAEAVATVSAEMDEQLKEHVFAAVERAIAKMQGGGY